MSPSDFDQRSEFTGDFLCSKNEIVLKITFFWRLSEMGTVEEVLNC